VTGSSTILPNAGTYIKVRQYTRAVQSAAAERRTAVFNKTLTLREFLTILNPEYFELSPELNT
jgi:hypothetical protein